MQGRGADLPAAAGVRLRLVRANRRDRNGLSSRANGEKAGYYGWQSARHAVVTDVPVDQKLDGCPGRPWAACRGSLPDRQEPVHCPSAAS